MKCLRLQGTIVCMLLVYTASSQVTALPLNQHPIEKASLFGQLPEKFKCSSTHLQQFFTAGTNNRFSKELNNTLTLNDQLQIEGVLLEKVTVTAQQLSVNIRCSNLQNALLTISRITQPDGSFKYTGRIVSPDHGDILILKEEKGEYSFIKQKQLLTMVE